MHLLTIQSISFPVLKILAIDGGEVCNRIINNYWMRFSVILRIIKAEVCVICRNRRLKQVTPTEALIILDITRKPNSMIILLSHKIHTNVIQIQLF